MRPALTAGMKGAGRGAGNGCVFFLLKGRGCGRRRGGGGDDMERAKSFGTTGILCDAVFLATLPNFPFIFSSPFEPKGCEFFGSLEVGVGVGNDLFFLGG